MELLMQKLFEEAKKSKKNLVKLKSTALHCQMFELAAKLRDLEIELFPNSEEYNLAYEQAKKINLLFRMVELNIPESVCWLLEETLKVYKNKKGKFDLLDASKLVAKKNELFTED
jgi:hypothetical protein